MSVVVGVWGISASRNALKASKYELVAKTNTDSEKERSIPRIWSSEDGTWLTLLIYAAAAVVGLVGLISLVVENFWVPGVWKITTVFCSLILGTGLAFLALWWCVDTSGEKGNEHRHSKALLRGLGFSSFGVVPTLMLILAAFFSDWVLGALAGSLVGVPSDDNSYLYWVSNVILRGHCSLTGWLDIFCSEKTTALPYLILSFAFRLFHWRKSCPDERWTVPLRAKRVTFLLKGRRFHIHMLNLTVPFL